VAADLDVDVGLVGLAGAPEHQQEEGEDGDEHECRQGVAPTRRRRPGAPPVLPSSSYPTLLAPLPWPRRRLLRDAATEAERAGEPTWLRHLPAIESDGRGHRC
jgi:hypothetical protein